MASSDHRKLGTDFYRQDDVVGCARALLGKVLCTRLDGVLTQILISETEAYAGANDRASHAYGNRRTKRTEPMFADGGIAYVYLCYGIHHLFNVVTNREDVPHAVLIRAGVPRQGLEVMLARRGKTRFDKTLLAGPGSVAKALGISTALTGTSLQGRRVWIETDNPSVNGSEIKDEEIIAGPRIGVDYAGEDALLPYRFRIADSRLEQLA